MTSRQTLAVYLVTIALLQSGLYFSFLQSNGMGAAFYFDPRIGIDAMIMSGPMTHEEGLKLESMSQLIRWIAAAWILILGLLFMAQRSVTKLYVISECLLSLPSLLFFLLVIAAGMSSAHGFSIGELLLPLIVFSVYTVIPLSIGVKDWRL